MGRHLNQSGWSGINLEELETCSNYYVPEVVKFAVNDWWGGGESLKAKFWGFFLCEMISKSNLDAWGTHTPLRDPALSKGDVSGS